MSTQHERPALVSSQYRVKYRGYLIEITKWSVKWDYVVYACTGPGVSAIGRRPTALSCRDAACDAIDAALGGA